MNHAEQKEVDLHSLIQEYRQELHTQIEKYLTLQKKFEAMKKLELNLRYEIYQLKQQQLKQNLLNQNTYRDVQCIPLVESYQDEFARVLGQRINGTGLERKKMGTSFNPLHRPYKEISNTTGLGKEFLISMKDNDGSNHKQHKHNKDDIQNNYEQLDKYNNDQKQVQKNTSKRNDKANDLSRTLEKPTYSPPKSEINNFNDLRKLVDHLKHQLNNKDQHTSKEEPNHTTNKQKSSMKDKKPQENSQSGFTFRNLQKAQHIYTKPRSRLNTTTTTIRVNRASEHHIQNKEQVNNNQKTVPKELEEDKKVKVGNGAHTNIMNEKKALQEKQVENKNIVNNEQGFDSRVIGNEVTEQTSEKSLIKDKEVDENRTSSPKRESLMKTESETNKNILNEFEFREADSIQSEQTKEQSFLKSIWRKLKFTNK